MESCCPDVQRIVHLVNTQRTVDVWLEAEGADRVALERAVELGGGRIVEAGGANAIVWAAGGNERIRRLLRPGVEWVQVWDAGFDDWWATGAVDGTRTWTAAKGVYALPIAEYCVAALLSAARLLPTVVRARRWDPLHVRSLDGAVVGIVGAGGIGAELISLLRPLGATTLALTRSGREVPGVAESLGPEGLDQLLAASDYVVLAAPLTPETDGLLSAERLALMRDTAWLVNVGRGRLVDTSALVAALVKGSIAGAVLDVTDPEPLPDGHPLWQQPNTVITSHTACTAELGRAALAARVVENVRRFAAGEPLLGVVDLDAGY